MLDRLKAGFNVPKIFRSAQAFGAAAIHLIGIGPFDPAPSKGAFRKVPAKFLDDFSDSYQQLLADDYHIFALSPDADQLLTEAELPARSAFLFGHEEMGLQINLADYPEIKTLAIPQAGDIESLNVSIAASIVMYEYTRQHPLN
ncbi:MAG: TrmH family RNA methyltransferase [bacterium]